MHLVLCNEMQYYIKMDININIHFKSFSIVVLIQSLSIGAKLGCTEWKNGKSLLNKSNLVYSCS